MGIDISSMLLFGMKYSEVPKYKKELIDEFLDEDTLSYASPYYDCPRKDWVIGVEIDSVMSLDDSHDLTEQAAQVWRVLTGIFEGRIICTPNVW
jgi:hypothetical protein